MPDFVNYLMLTEVRQRKECGNFITGNTIINGDTRWICDQHCSTVLEWGFWQRNWREWKQSTSHCYQGIFNGLVGVYICHFCRPAMFKWFKQSCYFTLDRVCFLLNVTRTGNVHVIWHFLLKFCMDFLFHIFNFPIWVQTMYGDDR